MEDREIKYLLGEIDKKFQQHLSLIAAVYGVVAQMPGIEQVSPKDAAASAERFLGIIGARTSSSVSDATRFANALVEDVRKVRSGG